MQSANKVFFLPPPSYRMLRTFLATRSATITTKHLPLYFSTVPTSTPAHTTPHTPQTIYSTGRRKTSAARVFLSYPGTGIFMVNKRSLLESVKLSTDVTEILSPFDVTNTYGLFDIKATVKGGGTTGQSGAIRHGVSRCLEQFDKEAYRVPLKRAGFLTRDSRMVERKKPGKPKARKSRQWVKR